MESGVADWGYRFRQVELYNHQVGRWGLVERLMLFVLFFLSHQETHCDSSIFSPFGDHVRGLGSVVFVWGRWFLVDHWCAN